jgi:hypothetical protein
MYYTDEFLHERFLLLILTELHFRGHAVDRREFHEFLEAMSPLSCLRATAPRRWADAFMEATGGKAAGAVPVG